MPALVAAGRVALGAVTLAPTSVMPGAVALAGAVVLAGAVAPAATGGTVLLAGRVALAGSSSAVSRFFRLGSPGCRHTVSSVSVGRGAGKGEAKA